jgi:O-antigen/teichoic acid export membrane protein
MNTPFKTFLKFSFGTWINAIISVVSIPIITWFILPDELGKATMFTLAYNLLLNIFQLGQDQSFARHYNDVQEKDRPLLLLNTLAPALTMCLIGIMFLEFFRRDISNLLFSTTDETLYVDLLSLVIPCGVISRFAQLVVRMKGRAFVFSMIQVALTSTNLVFTILYAKFVSADFTAVVAGFCASQVACLIVGILSDLKMWTAALKTRIARSEVREQLRFGLPFVPTFVFDWLFQSTDRTFLRMYSTFTEIGIYSTATRISAALNVLQTGFSTFWIPFVYQRYTDNEEDKSFYQITFESVYLTFAVAILVILACKELIFLILPPEYAVSIDIFPLILFVPMLYTLSEITGVGINLKKRTIFHFYILAGSALISLCLGLYLIRFFGAKGAIITNFTSFVAFFSFRSIIGSRLYPLPLNWKKFALTFFLVLMPVAFTFLWPKSSPYLLLAFCAVTIFSIHLKTAGLLWSKVYGLIEKT